MEQDHKKYQEELDSERLIKRFKTLGLDEETSKKCASIVVEEIITEFIQANLDLQIDDDNLKGLVNYFNSLQTEILK